MSPGEWCDAFFSLELAHPWKVGAFLFPAPGIPLKKVSLGTRKECWSLRKNHGLFRAEGKIKLKHGVEEMIRYRARSKDLESGEGCRKPRCTCSQALDLELVTSSSDPLPRRVFHSPLI